MNQSQNIPIVPTGLTDDQIDLFVKLAEAICAVIEEAQRKASTLDGKGSPPNPSESSLPA